MGLGVALADCEGPLASAHDAALYDLDGVLHLSGEEVPHAAESVAGAAALGLRPAYVTNNASRSPLEVAALLERVGVSASAEDVVTSAQAAARVLWQQLDPGAQVLVVGTEALSAEVRAVGLTPVGQAGPDVAAVVQGLSVRTSWEELAEASVALRAGALWVATNTDATYPSPRGPLPGNGALVAALERATGRSPLVAGKPEPALHATALARTGASRPLVVGDRLDTDVLGAVRAGTPSLLVLTGVTDDAALLAAPEGTRPSYVAADLRGLLVGHPPVRAEAGGWRCDQAVVGGDGRTVEAGPDPTALLRARCAAAWATA